jgi:penicillin-binding protein 1A
MRDSPPPDPSTAEPAAAPTRLVLVESPPPPRGKWGRFLIPLSKVGAFLALTGLTAVLLATVVLYYQFSQGLPEIPKVSAYAPPVLTEVFTDDQVLAGEFYEERRKVVPYERIPKRLVQAFIASEDAAFFDHFGLDPVGTARAAFKTLLHKASGTGGIQGGSTLTQQTAKALLISMEGFEKATRRKGQAGYVRKIKEAILARRLEAALTKEEILYLYLNNVYLGHHAYGVQAAAENYFRKDVRDLTLAEMALIAGLPQAPSRYSPFMNPKAATDRRGYVLRRMQEEGMISRDEHDAAGREAIHVYPVEDVFHEFAPYFVEQVRKDVVQRYGNPALLTAGLKVFTTMDSERQRAAQDAMLSGLLAVDKRQGFRGALNTLDTPEQRRAFISKSTAVLGGGPLQEATYYVGLVTALNADGTSATVQVGPHQGQLPLLGMRWARKVNPEAYYPGAMLGSLKRVLKPGDVVVVRTVKKKDLYDDKEQYDKKLAERLPEEGLYFRLEQEPELQGALVSIDPWRQYLVAMVGGYDFDANEYNRAFQACRQPGSSFKPVVYSAAIEQLGWTEAQTIVDSPIVENDPEHQVRWKPENYTEDFHGDVLLRTAIINSMNIPAVKTFVAVGIDPMAAWAKKLGLSTPMNRDFSAALGSSCVYPWELAQVYATFARLGNKRATYFIRRVEDRYGRMLEDHTAYDDPWASLTDRIAAGYARLYEPGEQVMTPETAYILTDLLRGVVREGTGAPAQRLGKPAAGKTGTTNDSFDAWFVGFTHDLVGLAWVGYDLNPHPLSRYETGGRAALPIWVSYMQKAVEGRPEPEFTPPESLELEKKTVDTKTGKLASSGSKTAAAMWFKKGTAPSETTQDKKVVDPNQFMQVPN